MNETDEGSSQIIKIQMMFNHRKYLLNLMCLAFRLFKSYWTTNTNKNTNTTVYTINTPTAETNAWKKITIFNYKAQNAAFAVIYTTNNKYTNIATLTGTRIELLLMLHNQMKAHTNSFYLQTNRNESSQCLSSTSQVFSNACPIIFYDMILKTKKWKETSNYFWSGAH